MKISIVIPFHNEEKIAAETINRVLNIMKKNKFDYEIITVNDNSDDKTGLILDKLSKKNKTVKSIHKKNQSPGPSGLGSALRYGFNRCSGDIIITFMGDLSDNSHDIPKMVKKFSNNFDIVCGSRFIKGSRVIKYPKIKLICNRIYNRLFSFLFSIPTKDISNGFKVYRREVIETVGPTSNGFEITSEIVLKAHIKGFKITEVPVSWCGRKEGRESKFGSFSSINFLFLKLPIIGIIYGKLSLSLWLRFIKSKIF